MTTLRAALLVLLSSALSTAILAQAGNSPAPIRLQRDPATTAATREWVEVAYPLRRAQRLGIAGPDAAVRFKAKNGALWPAVRGVQRGRQAIFFQILAQFEGNEASGDLEPGAAPGQPTAFKPHPAVGAGKPPTPQLRVGDGYRDVFKQVAMTTTRSTAAAVTERFVFQQNGDDHLQVHVFRTRWADSPVVDFRIGLTNQTNRPLKVDVRIGFGDGAKASLRPTSRFSELSVAGNAVTAVVGLDPATWVPIGVRCTYGEVNDLQPEAAALWRAAAGERPAAMFQGWGLDAERRWLTLGVRAKSSPSVTEFYTEALAAAAQANKSVYVERIRCQQFRSSTSGTQRFGFAATGATLDLDPQSTYRLMRNQSEDEMLRSTFWFEADGSAVMAANHPGAPTFNRDLHEPAVKDCIQFGGVYPRVGEFAQRTSDDRQHVDDLAIHAACALFDDPDFEETVVHQVQRERADYGLAQGWLDPSPRGWGRPVYSLATAAWLFEGTLTGGVARHTCEDWVQCLDATWEGKTSTGLIRPVRTYPDDDSKVVADPNGKRLRAFVHYEHGTCVSGLIATAHITTGAKRALSLQRALDIDKTVIALSFYDAEQDAWLYPFMSGILSAPGEADFGQPPPAEWRTKGTPGWKAAYHEGGGWTRWTACGPYLLLYMHSMSPEGIPADLLDCARSTIAHLEKEQFGKDQDEANRMMACPSRIEQAPFETPIASPEPPAGVVAAVGTGNPGGGRNGSGDAPAPPQPQPRSAPPTEPGPGPTEVDDELAPGTTWFRETATGVRVGVPASWQVAACPDGRLASHPDGTASILVVSLAGDFPADGNAARAMSLWTERGLQAQKARMLPGADTGCLPQAMEVSGVRKEKDQPGTFQAWILRTHDRPALVLGSSSNPAGAEAVAAVFARLVVHSQVAAPGRAFRDPGTGARLQVPADWWLTSRRDGTMAIRGERDAVIVFAVPLASATDADQQVHQAIETRGLKVIRLVKFDPSRWSFGLEANRVVSATGAARDQRDQRPLQFRAFVVSPVAGAGGAVVVFAWKNDADQRDMEARMTELRLNAQ